MREVRSTSLTLPATARSTTEARRFVVKTLSSWGLESLVDTAALLTSEVVTNAVLHARTELHIDLTRDGEGVTIAVSDGSRRGPVRRRQSVEATTGRGIELLDRLADTWSVTTRGDGKTMSFRLVEGSDPWGETGRSAREARS